MIPAFLLLSAQPLGLWSRHATVNTKIRRTAQFAQGQTIEPEPWTEWEFKVLKSSVDLVKWGERVQRDV